MKFKAIYNNFHIKNRLDNVVLPKMYFKMSSANTAAISSETQSADALRPEWNGRHVADDILKYIFINAKFEVWLAFH